ncbi:MAG TPA: FtsX-like permease family protein [candidate division Zixibacteria bacterium]|nr:FtsX-like permease family protein [candidate division Zixibacteria bacterium]
MRLGALAWRGLAARPLRTALTIAGVALGVALITATLMASQATAEGVRRAAQELFGAADIRVRAFDDAGFTPRAVTALRQIPGVMNAAPVAERRGQVSTAPSPEDRTFVVLMLGVDPDDEARIRRPNLTAGSYLDPSEPEGVLVGAGWAEENGFGIGTELRLTGGGLGVLGVRIVGLLDEVGFGSLASGAVMVLDREFLSTAFETPAPIRYVDLDVAADRVEDVQAALDATMTEPFVVETVADAEQQLARAQAGFAGLAFLFGLVGLAVGAFLVANTLALTLAERTREIGLLRAAGMTSRQVLSVFLRQGLILAVAGSVLGLVLGIGLAAVVMGFLRSTRAIMVTGLPLHPGGLLLALVLGTAVTLAAAAVPALAAARVSPLDALRPSRQPGRTLGGRLPWVAGLAIAAVALGSVAYPFQRGQASAGGTLAAVAVLVAGTLLVAVLLHPLAALVGRPFAWFFGAEGLLGRANLGRDRVRTGLTVGTLAIGLAAVVALGTVSSSARATADRWVASILPGGHGIRFIVPPLLEGTPNALDAGIPGLRLASPIPEVGAVLVDEDGAQEVSVAGIEPSVFQDEGALIFTVGERAFAFNALRAGGSVLLPEPLAVREGLRPGDVVRLARPGEEPQEFRVAGTVAYSIPGRTSDGAILVSLTDALNRFGVTEAALWALAPQPDVPDGAFAQAVASYAAGQAAEPLTAEGLAGELGRSLGRVIGLFDVLALLAVVIGALGIVNTLSMGVAERAREIGILRSHGMTVGQVQAMVVAEAAIIGAVGGLAAVLIGLLVAWTTVAFGAPRDFAAGLEVPWALMAAVVLVGVGVASLAGIYPARRAARLPITDSLRHFE